jgi:hypothetical protein
MTSCVSLHSRATIDNNNVLLTLKKARRSNFDVLTIEKWYISEEIFVLMWTIHNMYIYQNIAWYSLCTLFMFSLKNEFKNEYHEKP